MCLFFYLFLSFFRFMIAMGLAPKIKLMIIVIIIIIIFTERNKRVRNKFVNIIKCTCHIMRNLVLIEQLMTVRYLPLRKS